MCNAWSVPMILFALRCRVVDERSLYEMPSFLPSVLCPSFVMQFKRTGTGTSSGYEEKQETSSRQSVEGSSLQFISIHKLSSTFCLLLVAEEIGQQKQTRKTRGYFWPSLLCPALPNKFILHTFLANTN